MATTATPFTPEPQRFAYVGIGSQSVDNPIPQAEVIFALFNQVVTAAAAGEDQNFSITCNLPKGYGYILSSVSLGLSENEAGDLANWNSDLRARLTAGDNLWRATPLFTASALYLRTAVLKGRSFQIPDPPNKIILSIGDNQATFAAESWTATIDQGSLAIDFLAKFLQFDLRQAYHWAVNTPWPVR